MKDCGLRSKGLEHWTDCRAFIEFTDHISNLKQTSEIERIDLVIYCNGLAMIHMSTSRILLPSANPTHITRRARLKENRVREKFMLLRAEGQSFEKIASQLKVSKQTLINWSKEHCEQISNMRACRLETLYWEYYVSEERRLRLFGDQVASIKAELERRDLSDVPTDRLLALLAKYAELIKTSASDLSFRDEEEIAIARANQEWLSEVRRM